MRWFLLVALGTDEPVLRAAPHRCPERCRQLAGFQISLDQHDTSQGNAAAFQGHVDRVIRVREMGTVRPIHVHSGQFDPTLPIRRGSYGFDAFVMQELQPRQRAAFGDLLGHGGRTDRRQPLLCQHLGIEVFGIGDTEPDRRIDPITMKIQRAEGSDETQFQLRVFVGKAEEPRSQPFGSKGRPGSDRQLVLILQLSDLTNGLAERGETIRNPRLKRPSRIGQLDGPIQAQEQRHAEMFLQLLDLIAQRRGRDKELFCRLRKAHVARGGLERA